MRATQNALRAVINLVENSQLVNLSGLLKHRVIGRIQLQWYLPKNSEEQAYSKTFPSTSISAGILYCSGRYGMIWRIATPSLENHQTQDGTSYKWLDYFHEVTSICFARHNNAQCIISVNDPCTEISTKDDE